MQVDQIVKEIDREIERLQQARALLAGTSGPRAGQRSSKADSSSVKKRRRKRKLTPEGRKRISDALKARWEERRKAAAKAAKK